MVPEPSSSRDTARYRALVLGPFALERDGILVDTSKWQRRIETLFKLLATAPDRQRLRDDVIDMLWPDAGPETGAGNLRMLAHRLRMALGGDPPPVLSEHGWIMLNPAYVWDSDLDDFEALTGDTRADLATLEQAAALYRGEPLAEDRYEDWAAPIRERVQRLWRDLCLRLAGHYRSRGSYDEAARWFERVLETDPIDEEALRGLLVVLGHGGRSTDALRRYRSFEQRLIEELDVPPSAETMTVVKELRAQLETGASEPRPPERALAVGGLLGATPDIPLVGRQDELERIFFAVDAALQGAGRLVLLGGESGVGKTRLAQEVMMRLREMGAFTAGSCCYERYQGVPYSSFLSLLPLIYDAAPASIRHQVSRCWSQLEWLLPDRMSQSLQAAPVDGGEQLLMFHGVAGFLGAVAEDRPIALLLDDLQWADEGSLALLQHLARHTRGHRVLLLGTYRDGDISRDHPLNRVVRDLGRDGLVERITVPRLSPDGAAALAEAILGEMAAPDEFLEFVYRRTKGNPFFIRKMVGALGGRYRLVRQIGAGGMGRVFEAEDTRTGEAVAAKIMFARTEADAKALLRFRQEGALLATLDHPNIVKVRGAFVEEHASCIVMELLKGRSLGQLQRSERTSTGGLSLAPIKHLTQQVAAGLSFAHERGIVHRDIKPDNIMVDDEDHVTVTDFGIARLLRPAGNTSTPTSTGMTMGTPLYMAPEQIEGKRVDGRSDVYALGAVLYELVTGRPPFEGEDALSIAFKHVHEAPLPPRWINGAIPEDWEALILKALAKDPVDRFQTAVAMERAIAGLSERDRSGVVPAGPPLEKPDGGAVVVSARAGRVEPAPDRTTGRERSPRFGRRALSGVAGLLVAAVVAYLVLGRVTAPAAGSTAGQFDGPTGLTLDLRGDVYVVDQGNDRVQEFSPGGAPLARWGTKGKGTLQFDAPSDVAISPNGDLYVSDGANKRIQVLRSGRQIDEIDFNGGSIAVDTHGNLYATDYFDSVIRKYPYPVDRDVWTAPAVPEITVGRFPYPAGVTVDAKGIIYVADREHDRFVELSAAGKLLFAMGNSGKAPDQFNRPSDVALDRKGDIYVADTRNDRIQKFSPDRLFLTQWGSPGTRIGQFEQPVCIAVDARGNIYVSDHFNNRVQKLSPSGKPIWATDGVSLGRG